MEKMINSLKYTKGYQSMNILMLTNTYKPRMGEVENSIELFSKELRARGHRVVIVGPEHPDMEEEMNIVRIPPARSFNGSDFSTRLPVPSVLNEALENFKPDIVHAYHPFLVGDTAIRIASKFNVPLVFTQYTLFEESTYPTRMHPERMKNFVIEVSTGYANLADHVIVPSENLRDIIRERGVSSPVSVVPTGIYTEWYRRGAGKRFRRQYAIPQDCFVIGYAGRLTSEKNLEFLSAAVIKFLKKYSQTCFLLAGKGPLEAEIKRTFEEEGLLHRLHITGVLTDKDQIDCYHAMDVFAFASQTETQAIVLSEAMSSKLPVVAVDASGVREIVKDEVNGRLVKQPDLKEFVAALEWIYNLTPGKHKTMEEVCRRTANKFSMQNSAKRLIRIYASLAKEGFVRRPMEEKSPWLTALHLVEAQWELTKNLTKISGALLINK